MMLRRSVDVCVQHRGSGPVSRVGASRFVTLS